MKIDKFHSNYINNAYKTKDEAKKGYVPGSTSNKSTVEISSQAKELIKRISESEESNFSEKVEKIRRSIQQGTYKILEKIDSERLESK
jgi:negative regulator of flagellin synthesis FlgM